MEIITNPIVLAAIFVILGLFIALIGSFFRTVEAGTILLVSNSGEP